MILNLARVMQANGLGDALRRYCRRVDAPSLPAHMQLRQFISHASVTRRADAIVSLAGCGSRLRAAHLTIRPLDAATHKTRHLVLRVHDPIVLVERASALRQRLGLGLALRLGGHLRTHKECRAALEFSLDVDLRHLVTVDYDVIYPVWWSGRLMATAGAIPLALIAYRARQVSLAGSDSSHRERWPLSDSIDPSLLQSNIGEASSACPRLVADALRQRGAKSLGRAARVDGIRLYSNAQSICVPARQVVCRPQRTKVVCASRSVVLGHRNVGAEGERRRTIPSQRHGRSVAVPSTYDEGGLG